MTLKEKDSLASVFPGYWLFSVSYSMNFLHLWSLLGTQSSLVNLILIWTIYFGQAVGSQEKIAWLTLTLASILEV